MTLIFLAALVLCAVNAFAGPSKTTYQAKIVKPDGYPLESSSVNFKFSILEPAGSCVLYAETYSSVNMNTTGGLISFSLGSGLKTFPASSTTFENIFSNITPNMACDTGGGVPSVYTPGANDSRKIIMQFNDGNGWQTLPAMNINAVPYAMYANEAMKLNGLGPSDFVQMTMMPTCAASEALRYNGASFNCVAVASSVAVTSSTIITALGYTPADPAVVSTNFATSASFATVTSTVTSLGNSVTAISSLLDTTANSATVLTAAMNSVVTSVSNLTNTVSAITSSQWTSSGTSIYYNSGPVAIKSTNALGSLTVGSGVNNSESITLNALNFAWYGWYLGGVRTAFIQSTASEYSIYSQTSGVPMTFYTSSTERVRISPAGNVGINTNSPVTKLEVSGGLRISMEPAACSAAYAGTLRYNAGLVEYCNGTSWSAFGISGAGILSVNGSTSGTQTFSIGTAGTVPAFVTINGVHTLNIPLASAGSVSAGLLSNADYSTFSNKITSSAVALSQVLGYTPANQTSMAASFAAVTTTTNTLATSVTANTAAANALAASMTANTIAISSNASSLTALSASVTALAVSGWNLTGNSGTSATVNYLGTSDGVDVAFRRANLHSGLIGSVNTSFGYRALSASSVTGSYNSAFGVDALLNNTTGQRNTAIGYQAGYNAGVSLQTNSNSVFIGDSANSSVNGLTNAIAIGYQAQATQNNQVVLGNTSIIRTVLRGAVETSVTDASSGLTVVNTTSTAARYPVITIANYASGTTGHPVLSMSNSGGEASAPAGLVAGMNLGTLLWTGQVTSSQTMQGARIDAIAEASFATNAAPTRMAFSVAGPTGAYQQRMVIRSSGNIGVGESAPSALLHLAAATSSVASLRLNAGVLLTTPQSGTIEYDGSNFYTTDSLGVRRSIATGSSSGSVDTGSISNASGSITLTPNDAVVVSSTTPSNNAQTGALVVKGGVGVSGSINAAANINVSGSAVIDGSLRLPAFTNGSVLFAGTGGVLAQDNSKFFWDNSNKRLGIGTALPNVSLNVSGSGIIVDNGTTASYGSGIKFLNTTFRHYSVGLRGSDFVVADTSTTGTQTWAAAPQERLVINSSGNTGVGTSSPSARLEVTSPNDTSTALYVGNSVSSGVTGLYFSRWGSASAPMGIQGTISGVGANAITLQAQAGSVGIGTTSPVEKLTVYDGSVSIPYVANKTHGYQLGLGNNLAYLWRNYSYADDSFFISQNWYANDAGVNVIPNVSHTAQAIELRRHVGVMLKTGPVNTVPVARLTVDPDGLVGIGTTTPGARLHVTTPSSASVNNRFVTGNSNADLVTATGLSGELILDHSVGARFQATAPTSLTRIITYKIDGAPTVSGTLTADELLALYVQSGNSSFGGNLGIGTTQPIARLQVRDTMAITNTAGPQYLLMGNQDSSGVSHPAVIVSANGNIEFGSGNTWSLANGGSFTSKFYFGDNGNLGIGTSNPTSRLTNINAAAVNANVGNENGTGENASSFNWGTAAAGYSAAISNNSAAGGANGLQVRTLGTTPSNIVFTAGIGVSSAANTKDILTVRSDSRVGVNTINPLQPLTVNGMMALQTNSTQDHVYMEFYARSAAPTTRTGWLGYPGAASTIFTMTNEISGGHLHLQTTGTGKVGINNAAPSYLLDVGGTIRGYGITDSSDIRLKKTIQPLDFSLEKILAVNGVSYYWKDSKISERKQIGFIAQQLEKIFPELVETDNQGVKSVNYSHLVAPLVEAVKSLYAKISRIEEKQNLQARELASVKAENAAIKAENEKLKDRLDRLEKVLDQKK